MKLSKYIKTFRCEDRPEYEMLFSTKKASTVLLHKSVLKSIQGDENSEDIRTLAGLGFLVRDTLEEKKEMLGIIDKANGNRTGFNTVAVMNLDCNLACRYCFEGTMKGRHYMSEKTARRFISLNREFIEKGRNIKVTFYGGEPLLSIEMIKYISGALRAEAEKHGLKYEFGVVTNGTLLSAGKVEELVSFGMRHAKITIDGPARIHDRQRPFVSGQGSFTTIIRNIKAVKDKVRIQIGGNFSRMNYREFPELLDYMKSEGIAPHENLMVKFDPITKINGSFALPDFRDGCESVTEEWLIEASIFLREEILKRGYSTARMRPAPCMMQIRDDLVVNYDGSFYKCPALIGLEDYGAGSLEGGARARDSLLYLDSWKNGKCLECEYLPFCFGGCRFMKMQKDGVMEGVDCRREYFDKILEIFIKQDIKYRNDNRNRPAHTT